MTLPNVFCFVTVSYLPPLVKDSGIDKKRSFMYTNVIPMIVVLD